MQLLSTRVFLSRWMLLLLQIRLLTFQLLVAYDNDDHYHVNNKEVKEAEKACTESLHLLVSHKTSGGHTTQVCHTKKSYSQDK